MAQEEILDFVVVGAGPAGLQAAYCLAGGSATFRVLEGSEYVGNFYHHNPRHGKLISINKTHNMCQHVDYSLRHDWNSLLCDDPTLVFPEFTEEFFPPREVLVEYMEAFATKLDLRKHISFNERVTKATKDKDGIFTVTSTSLTLRCRALLMATGAVAEHCPDIPGLDVLPTYGTHNLDTKKYRRKKVLIIGKGNSAFECADHLSAAAGNLVVLNRTPVKFAWDTHFVGHLRAVNNNFLDMVRLKSNHSVENWQPIRACKIADAPAGTVAPSPSSLCGRDPAEAFKYCVTVRAQEGVEFDFICDEVIRCTGFTYVDTSIFDETCTPTTKKDGRLAVLDHEWQSENVPGLYFLGTSMQAADPHTASGFIHGFRYNVRTCVTLLMHKYKGVAIPFDTLPLKSTPIAEAICERLSHSSALWQLFNFIIDVIVANPETGEVRHYKELRHDWVLDHSGWMKEWPCVFIVAFDFGEKRYTGETPKPFDVVTPAKHVACGVNIHPVVTSYFNGQIQRKLHLRVTLDGHWQGPGNLSPVFTLVNSLLKVDEQEPSAKAPFDFFKPADQQCGASETTASPEDNVMWLEEKGYLTGSQFDELRPCTMPLGARA